MNKTPFILVEEVAIDECYSVLQVTLKLDTVIDSPCYRLFSSDSTMDEITLDEIDSVMNRAKEIANTLNITIVIKDYSEIYDIFED